MGTRPGAAEAAAAGDEAWRRQAWGEARDCFAVADEGGELTPADLRRYASACVLTGDEDAYVRLMARSSHAWADAGDAPRAAECAGYLAMSLALRGEWGPATGWLQRAHELLAGGPEMCAARALLIGLEAIQLVFGGQAEAAHQRFLEAQSVARACADPDTMALSAMGVGQALIAGGRTAEGLPCLDHVMVAVTTGELDPVLTGVIYCAVIDAFQECHEARRAAEWTRALSQWCSRQPDLVPYRGNCLVHEAQIATLQGEWREALARAVQARDRLSGPPVHPAIGAACYQEAELHRLTGRFDDAESCYRQAGTWGRDPQPGLALLRLAQGDANSAGAGLTRALEEGGGPLRPDLLAAAVEVALASGDLASARAHSDELAQHAASGGTVQLTAMAAVASGSVLLADDQPGAALPVLRHACSTWRAIDAPYFLARSRELLAEACAALGDTDTAGAERAAALATYDRLGAVPDATRVVTADAPRGVSAPDGLSAREVEVLRLVAEGRTNREIAALLVLSEKTVARHLSNIFTKIDVPTRSAATAYAYRTGVVRGPG